jgi:transcriptional regulator with XRE-family HTH domain
VEIGSYLQELRAAKGLTTAQLARKAGIRRATLSEWQSGKRQPRLPELESVLNALNASDTQKRQAKERLGAPAQIFRLRQERTNNAATLLPPEESAPHGGTLLRALRMRRGWTQTQLAQAVGVSQATLVRWERSELWPDTTQLHQICYLLHAHEEELVALTKGRFALTDDTDVVNEDTIREELRRLSADCYSRAEYALGELRLLTLMAQAYGLAVRSPSGCLLLTKVHRLYLERLYFGRRFTEANLVANRALDIYYHLKRIDKFTLCFAIRVAEISALQGGRDGVNNALEMLRIWQSRTAGMTNEVTRSGWLQCDMARFHALRGHTAEAIAQAKKTLQETAHTLSDVDHRFRRYDLINILLQANQAQEAQQYIEADDDAPCHFHPYFGVVQARMHLRLGENDLAQNRLQRVRTMLETPGKVDELEIPYYRHEVETLADQ